MWNRNQYVSSFESSSLLFQGRRNSGSSKLAGGVFQSYAPLVSSVLCPTRGWKTKCFFLKGKSWDSTDELKNVNHGMYSYLKTCIFYHILIFAGLIIHIVFVIEIYFTYKDLIEKPIDELLYIRFTVIDSSAFFGSILVL